MVNKIPPISRNKTKQNIHMIKEMRKIKNQIYKDNLGFYKNTKNILEFFMKILLKGINVSFHLNSQKRK